MSYKIGSFNVRNLSYGSGRDLKRIARIINKEDLDVVALQEVLSEGKALTGIHSNSPTMEAKAYERTLKYWLRGDWGIAWKSPQLRAKDYPYIEKEQRNEGYAFLWKKNKFELIKNEKGEGPVIYNNYAISPEEGQIRLKRDPCYGRFRVKHCNAELRLVTVHLIYGKPQGQNMSIGIDGGPIKMRQNEFKVVAGKIYPKISEYYKDESCRVPYTIILGDYNLNLRKSGILNAPVPEVICFDKNGRELRGAQEGYCKIYTVQEELTTLKKEEAGYANNYDHFSYDERVKKHLVKQVKRIEAVSETGSPGEQDFEKYKKEVSDHVPVVLEIDFK